MLETEPATLKSEVDKRHTPEVIEAEIQAFEDKVHQVLRGEMTDDQFRRHRLTHGTYGQRQPGMQMQRIKIPSGVLDPHQLRTIGAISDKYSNGFGHLTTRQNVQLHYIKLETVPAMFRDLAAAGMTTREACFNTVRTITSCPIAGICGDEAFDVTPYALGLTRFLLRHPDFNDLPRKFKIAFSGCEDDGNCAVAGIHDVGLIAQVHGNNGTSKFGFKVLVGGGLGALPTEAEVLTEFLPAEELIPTVEAVLRVFSKNGNRKNKMKARMKFVLREHGITKFREMVAEERKQVTTPAEVFTVASTQSAPLVKLQLTPPSPEPVTPEYDEWKRTNVMPQRQKGYASIWVKLPAGTITSDQFRGLADILEKNQLPGIRIAILQDFLIPWIPAQQVPAIYEQLRALDLVTPGARTISDVTGCPGATTCNLGITRSLTLADVLAKELADQSDPEIQKLRIKISGCPNSCGQHHIADIGFYGNARKIGTVQAPFYQMLLGGEVSERGVRFGKQIIPLAAKQVPNVVREVIGFYRNDRHNEESFRQWVERTPPAEITNRLKQYAEIAEHDPDTFVDWGDTDTYSLKLGRGECAS
ncbi:MAG TPA: nitrite/sulfite reductase [Terriglobales bacterium]|nr:nitrite/sulfite reductase [Terriglobales bacterium]